MIETFTYISEPLPELSVKYIDYSSLAMTYSNLSQSYLYGLINSTRIGVPYILSQNNIIFCHDGSGEDVLNKISRVFLGLEVKKENVYQLTMEARNIEFDEKNSMTFRRIVRESLIRQYRGGFRERYGIRYEVHDDTPDSKIKRYLMVNMSNQAISNSILMVMDLRHQNLGLDRADFKMKSSIDPLNRYRGIEKKVNEIFGSCESIGVSIPGNGDLTLSRIKV